MHVYMYTCMHLSVFVVCVDGGMHWPTDMGIEPCQDHSQMRSHCIQTVLIYRETWGTLIYFYIAQVVSPPTNIRIRIMLLSIDIFL